MAQLARLGGEATRKRAESEPGYYARIGRLGALAGNPKRKGTKVAPKVVRKKSKPAPVAPAAKPELAPIFADVEAVEVTGWDW